MKTSFTTFVFAALAVPALAACNPFDPELSVTPFLCGDEGECPEGYSCNADNICQQNGSEDPPIDAAASFQCANDTQLGDNNSPSTAYVTGIGVSTRELELVSLSICPSDDRDHYKFTAELDNLYLEIRAVGMADRAPLQVNLLNQQGTIVGSAGPRPDQTQVVTIPRDGAAPYQLARGSSYVVQVLAADQRENNYELSIKTCQDPPCE